MGSAHSAVDGACSTEELRVTQRVFHHRWVPDSLISALEKRFPAAAAYLSQIPEGFYGFPQCQMLADGPIAFRALYPQLYSHRDIPPALRHVMNAPWKANDWMPYVLAITMNEMLRDLLRMSEAEYVDLTVGDALRFLDRPAYRGMCRVLSPHLLLMGFNWRWNRFHRGIAMRNGGGIKTQHKLGIQYPPGLLPPITLNYYGGLFKRLLLANGARTPRVTLKSVGPGDTVYEMHWQG